MATVNLQVGSQLYGSVPVETLLAGGPDAMLTVAVTCYLGEPEAMRATSLVLPLPTGEGRESDGTLFKYVLCYLEDPEGFVLPNKEDLAKAILHQLGFFGLVDETRAQILQGLSFPKIMQTLAGISHNTRVANNVLNHHVVLRPREWVAVVRDPIQFAKQSSDWTAAQNRVWPWYTETCRKAELLFGERG